MTREQWQAVYDRAWHLYYSPEHIETLLRRATVSGPRPSRLASMIFYFYGSYSIEAVHPLQGGFLRRKLRRQRRSGMPLESPLPFFAHRVGQTLRMLTSALWLRLLIERIRWRVVRDSASDRYYDVALAPALGDYSETLELFETSASTRQIVARARSRLNPNRRLGPDGVAAVKPT
jgi:hypothetical protein